ncbi:hypothetical protein D3C87_1275260 [compost metagenome]
MSGTKGVRLSKVAISGPVPSMFCRTLMRTLSHLSPSIRSSPPRPWMMSLPAPPRRMLPPSNLSSAVPAMPSAPLPALPTRSRRPLIRSKLVSTLPLAPATASKSAVESSPLRKSAWADPDSPSTRSSRARIDALEPGTAG